jgi:hypothetical protein
MGISIPLIAKGGYGAFYLCRPLPYHLGTAPPAQSTSAPDGIRLRSTSKLEKNLERETGFEPATSTLARSHSTTELLPLSPFILQHVSV